MTQRPLEEEKEEQQEELLRIVGGAADTCRRDQGREWCRCDTAEDEQTASSMFMIHLFTLCLDFFLAEVVKTGADA